MIDPLYVIGVIAIAMALALIYELLKVGSLRRFVKGTIGLATFLFFTGVLLAVPRFAQAVNGASQYQVSPGESAILMLISIFGLIYGFVLYYDSISMEWIVFPKEEKSSRQSEWPKPQAERHERHKEEAVDKPE